MPLKSLYRPGGKPVKNRRMVVDVEKAKSREYNVVPIVRFSRLDPRPRFPGKWGYLETGTNEKRIQPDTIPENQCPPERSCIGVGIAAFLLAWLVS